MTFRTKLRRDAARSVPHRASRPELESLEDRRLLSSLNGGEWSNPQRITYSFMPDGTSIGGISSNLFQTLNKLYPTATWEQAFEKAAAVWQQVANVNLALVSDNGASVGSSGDQQGDPRFGDIRIGAYSQSSGQLAMACLPPPINGGTDAGDIFINSKVAWKINNDYDLETVAIHELGHALGLGHSAIQSAVMYASYTGMKQSLTSDDTSGIDQVYGGVPSNNSYTATSAAFDLTPYLNANGQAAVGGQSISSLSNTHYYKVTVPNTTTGTMVVTMQSSNLSSLSPRLAVLNSAGASLGQNLAQNTYGATVSYTVSGVSAGQVYYFRASAANSGPGSDGAYGISVAFGSTPAAAVAPPNTTVAAQPDQGGGSSDMTTGSSSPSGLGLSVGGLLGLNVGLNSGLSVGLNLLGIEVAVKVQIGTLSVYAEALKAGTHPIHHHGHTPTIPAGPNHHHVSHPRHPVTPSH